MKYGSCSQNTQTYAKSHDSDRPHGHSCNLNLERPRSTSPRWQLKTEQHTTYNPLLNKTYELCLYNYIMLTSFFEFQNKVPTNKIMKLL